MNYVLFILAAVFVNNYILSQFLGICPFLGVSKKVETAAGMGVAVIFVMTLASAATYFIYNFILVKLGIDYLYNIAFILVIAALVQFVEMFIKKSSPALYQSLGVYLPLITTNCAVLGVARSQNRLTVSRTGQGDTSLGYSGDGESLVWPLSTRTCTAGGSGTITGIRVKTIHRDGGSGSSTATWKLYVNGALSSQGTSGTLSFGPAEQEQVISVTSTRVSKGDSFYISVTCGSSALGFFAGSTEGTLGGTILITSSGVTGGTVFSTSVRLPERQRLRGWVRYSGGSVALSVLDSTWVPLTLIGTRATKEPGGTYCTEAEFALAEAVPQGEYLSFLLTLDLANSNTMSIYDYGVLLL